MKITPLENILPLPLTWPANGITWI